MGGWGEGMKKGVWVTEAQATSGVINKKIKGLKAQKV